MSYNTFPTFAGKGWGIKKRPITSTLIQQADSGAEYRTQRYQYPLYEFDIEIPYLSQSDYANLIGFFNQQGGPFLPFYFSADNDNAVAGQAFAITDGTTTQFQLVKSNGSYWSEPVGGVSGTPNIYANGTQIFQSGTGAPPLPALNQIAGGTKAARGYWVRLEYIDALGNLSGQSVETSMAVSANNLLTIQSPPPAPGATAWAVFIGTSSGAEGWVGSLNLGTNYTEPTSAISPGFTPSGTDHTAYSVSPSGVVSFGGAGQSGVALTWSGNYYYLVRFKDDHIEAEQTMWQIYEATTITLRTFR